MIEDLIEKHKIHVLGLTETFQKEDSAIRVKYNQVSATRPTEKKGRARGVAIITRVGIALRYCSKWLQGRPRQLWQELWGISQSRQYTYLHWPTGMNMIPIFETCTSTAEGKPSLWGTSMPDTSSGTERVIGEETR